MATQMRLQRHAGAARKNQLHFQPVKTDPDPQLQRRAESTAHEALLGRPLPDAKRSLTTQLPSCLLNFQNKYTYSLFVGGEGGGRFKPNVTISRFQG